MIKINYDYFIDLIIQFKIFLESKSRNIWLLNELMKVYIRKGRHIICGQDIYTLDIASIEIFNKSLNQKVIGLQFLNMIWQHELNPFQITYIENVLNPRFLKHLLDDGWILIEKIEPTPCVFRRKANSKNYHLPISILASDSPRCPFSPSPPC